MSFYYVRMNTISQIQRKSVKTDKKVLEIDGSYGEGGGQVLRTALSLSAILGMPFRMVNIRKGRKKTGLMPQHLMCIRAMAEITGAHAEGDFAGSTDLFFSPSCIRAGNYAFDIGTAGSTALLAQALLPPLFAASGNSSLTLSGGTHVPFSPIYDYLEKTFSPALAQIGFHFGTEILRYGFYPKGGGVIRLSIIPAREPQAVQWTKKDAMSCLHCMSAVANLPDHIAHRQYDAARTGLASAELRVEPCLKSVGSYGKGSYLFLSFAGNGMFGGFSALGEPGKKAETVGREAAEAFLAFHKSCMCVDRHLADQIVLYLSRAQGSSSFSTECVTGHLLTNLWVINQFLDTRAQVEGAVGLPGRILLQGSLPA